MSPMNEVLRDHLEATYFPEYQGLRDQLMAILTDEDLASARRWHVANLGSLCREIGEIEVAYVESFRTFRTGLRVRERRTSARAERAGARRPGTPELDRDLMAALEELSEEDVLTRRIVRSDFDRTTSRRSRAVQLDIYREALLIFYGKASVYLRAMERELPRQLVGLDRLRDQLSLGRESACGRVGPASSRRGDRPNRDLVQRVIDVVTTQPAFAIATAISDGANLVRQAAHGVPGWCAGIEFHDRSDTGDPWGRWPEVSAPPAQDPGRTGPSWPPHRGHDSPAATSTRPAR